ncbi:MAG: hypothetical protein HW387_1135 [Parachlamydiales bacterium]|nr:hypothetical protein [Parachlamydiales bacterium]
MAEPYIIHIDRLGDGAIQKIDAILSSEFIGVDEPDLHFCDAVKVCGEVYATDEDLVLHLNASTIAQMSCSVCNRPVPLPLSIKSYYHTEPLSAIKGTVFDFRAILRECLLIELPKIAECRGNCPERPALAPYLRQPAAPDITPHYFPFNDLKIP